ncbi:sigma-70 family RNA polymerase sigma factor [Blastopirellula sp. J2-11]|uniref:sigma-70 family RNA polymerase sigma factor n=1 Tax=Blastopirellula sp. J2-11 TaxID=2943192 RepID=UPI0021CA68EF|nr:sigma-70 family RNA polymerase sigma factor [Blastopirellula sp. J2-11]UUO07450.1 sigma-70 family RNA polymerase sigma factor [Blastopirellula sp. J2-11]
MNQPAENSPPSSAMTPAQSRELLARSWVKAQPSVLAFVIASAPQFTDAEDLLQEVAAEVAIRFDEYDVSRPFLPWALWVAKIKIADFYRGKKREKLVFVGEAMDALVEACTRVQDLMNEEQQALNECLGATTGRSRELLTMRYAQDMKPRQIAAKLGMSAAAVRVTLSRVRTALSDCVNQRLGRTAS